MHKTQQSAVRALRPQPERHNSCNIWLSIAELELYLTLLNIGHLVLLGVDPLIKACK